MQQCSGEVCSSMLSQNQTQNFLRNKPGRGAEKLNTEVEPKYVVGMMEESFNRRLWRQHCGAVMEKQ